MNKKRLTNEAVEKRLRGVNPGGVYVRWLEWGRRGVEAAAGPIGQVVWVETEEKGFRWAVLFPNKVTRYLRATSLAWAERPLTDSDLHGELMKERCREVEVIAGTNEGTVAPICRYMSDTGKWMIGEDFWYGQFPAHHLQFVAEPTSEMDVQRSCGAIHRIRHPAGKIEVSTFPVAPWQAIAPDGVEDFRRRWAGYKRRIALGKEASRVSRQCTLEMLSDEVMDFLLSRLK